MVVAEKLSDKKKIRMLGFLLMAAYFASYLTRINYGAVIAEIVAAEGIKKSAASLALTGSAVTYGLGQLLSGYLGDIINPKRLVLCGLIVSATVNILIPACNTVYPMIILWSINGLAQAFMWPPMVRIMTVLLNSADYHRVCIRVSWGGSFGTVAVYLFSPLLIKLGGWKCVFIVSFAIAALMIIIWGLFCPNITESLSETAYKGKENPTKFKFSGFLIIIMVVIALEGMLRDGITTWMPSYISESFGLGSGISILTGVVLPLFSIFTYQLTEIAYERAVNNAVLLSAIIFLIGFSALIFMAAFGSRSALLSVISAALAVGSMHGVSLLMTCMVPAFFGSYGKVSFISGLLNSCTYIGSALSTYGTAAFSESLGWNTTVYAWGFIALTGGMHCFLISKKWQKFTGI